MSKNKTYFLLAHKKELPQLSGLIKKESDFGYFETGIGMFRSMYEFHDFAIKNKPGSIVLIGSAGSFYDSDLLTIKTSHEFSLPEQSFEEIPEFIEKEWVTEESKLVAGVPKVKVYSGFGISRSIETYTFRENGEYWENMEALGISYVCKKLGIPFSAYFCCTNKIGEQGRKQWKENYLKAGELLFEGLRKLLP